LLQKPSGRPGVKPAPAPEPGPLTRPVEAPASPGRAMIKIERSMTNGATDDVSAILFPVHLWRNRARKPLPMMSADAGALSFG